MRTSCPKDSDTICFLVNGEQTWTIRQGADQLIAKIKSAAVKDKTTQAEFAAPQPVVARWGSQLNVPNFIRWKVPSALSNKKRKRSKKINFAINT